MRENAPSSLPTRMIAIAIPLSWTGMKQIHTYLNRISGSSRPGRIEDRCLSWWELIRAEKKRNEIVLKNVCSSDRDAFGGARLGLYACMSMSMTRKQPR